MQVTWRNLPPVAGASEDQKTFVFWIIHRYTPTDVYRVDTADGRSPGSRIGASPCLPGGTAPPVAFADETSRSQLRGQLRNWRTPERQPHRIPFSPSREGPSIR